MVNEKLSPGRPFTASGFAPAPVPPAAAGCVQLCRMVSGLYWKMTTFGSGMRNVSMNSTSAPFMNLPGISAAPAVEPPRQLGDDAPRRRHAVRARRARGRDAQVGDRARGAALGQPLGDGQRQPPRVVGAHVGEPEPEPV